MRLLAVLRLRSGRAGVTGIFGTLKENQCRVNFRKSDPPLFVLAYENIYAMLS